MFEILVIVVIHHFKNKIYLDISLQLSVNPTQQINHFFFTQKHTTLFLQKPSIEYIGKVFAPSWILHAYKPQKET